MRYFDFDGLEHKAQLLQSVLMVAGIYVLILTVSWLYTKVR